jgi:hypothetical protein
VQFAPSSLRRPPRAATPVDEPLLVIVGPRDTVSFQLVLESLARKFQRLEHAVKVAIIIAQRRLKPLTTLV